GLARARGGARGPEGDARGPRRAPARPRPLPRLVGGGDAVLRRPRPRGRLPRARLRGRPDWRRPRLLRDRPDRRRAAAAHLHRRPRPPRRLTRRLARALAALAPPRGALLSSFHI